ncbi:hypothetical protein IID23_02760 [Patescibacteria group bacterium]|nr:hypothetical protein [Patescibacteria group bacterium]
MIERLLVRLGLTTPLVILVILMGIAGVFGTSVAEAHPLPGSVMTTDLDGNEVNGNVRYSGRCEVAINGGPHQTLAYHLPNGDYDIAVTIPGGGTVLGEGHGTVTIDSGDGTFGPFSLCSLVTPSPYDLSPNNGDEYKIWVCFAGELFVNRHCKTDNFKVREADVPPVVPPPVQPPGLGPPVSKPPVQPPTTTTDIGTPFGVPGPSPAPEPEVPVKLPTTGMQAEQNIIPNLKETVVLLLFIGLAVLGAALVVSRMSRIRN